jgi:hypothetical protein
MTSGTVALQLASALALWAATLAQVIVGAVVSATALTAEFVLLSVLRSITAEVTHALVVKEHWDEVTLPTSLIVVEVSALMDPTANEIILPETAAGAGVADTKETPAGNVLVTVTDVAWSGPELLTIIV